VQALEKYKEPLKATMPNQESGNFHFSPRDCTERGRFVKALRFAPPANAARTVMTCRANEVEPYAYLIYLFEHLPAASTVEQVETLLPWNVKTMLEEQKKSQQRQQPSAA
jgi:hypothetical protein